MSVRPEPSFLKTILKYSPETGEVIWLYRPLRPGLERIDKGRNTRYAGEPAGRPDRHGHLYINIGGRNFSAHRIAWALFYGTWPSGSIDHINGEPCDNRISNLRIATQSDNLCNAEIRKDNTSGSKGVSWSKKSKKWYAYITKNGKMRSLGRFPTKEEAIEVRQKAARELHGEFARY